MKTLEFVNSSEGKTRLDKALATAYELDFTRSYLKKLIEDGCVLVNGDVVKRASLLISSGDVLKINVPETRKLDLEPENIPLDIVYEDDDIIVVNKQQGLSVHPSETEPSHTLVNALLYHVKDLSSINGVERPGIVHRIDKNTSGLLVVAKNDAAHLSLSRQIAEKSALRYYLALVDGNIKEDEGKINYPLGRDKNNRLRYSLDWTGKDALTDWFVKERFGNYTLLEIHLHTGRTHQIRAHMRLINHPVVGDELYGGSNKFKLSGQLLHAFSLTLTHPTTGKLMHFEAPLPEYYSLVLKKLRNN